MTVRRSNGGRAKNDQKKKTPAGGRRREENARVCGCVGVEGEQERKQEKKDSSGFNLPKNKNKREHTRKLQTMQKDKKK